MSSRLYKSRETRLKMSLAKLGKKRPPFTKEHKEKIRQALKGRKCPKIQGEKNWNWKGGITGEQGKIRNSSEYKIWRNSVYRRNNWTCKECRIKCLPKNIVAHHIKSFSEFPELRFEEGNGITLCRPCHRKLHIKLDEKNGV